jgi:hypothetical protein
VPAAPRLRLNPLLLRRVEHSGRPKSCLQRLAGFPHYATFFEVLRAEKVAATPLNVQRLERVADAVGFPRDEIFLDEAVTR